MIYALCALAGLVFAVSAILALRRDDGRRQRRLDRAFLRGRRAAVAGTGEQGHPYSVFGERVWKV